MSGLPSTTARTTVLSEFDEMMISKSIATREQRLRAKGFTAEQAAEILEAEAEEVAAEVNAAATQQLAQGEDRDEDADDNDDDDDDDDDGNVDNGDEDGDDGDGDGSDDDDDAGADADAALRAYRAARIAELKAAQAGRAELVQVTKSTWEADVAQAAGWVVVALHADPSLEEQAGRGVPAQCAALVAALRDVAARWSDVRCCQIAALDAIPPSQLGKLPGLFCYRDGALCHSLMGAEAVGAARSGPDLARTLAELGVLAPGAGAGGAVSDHESDDLDSD
jgi:hypothetical protein